MSSIRSQPPSSRSHELFKAALSFGGILVALKTGQLLRRIYPSFLPDSVLRKITKRYGANSWAVVTGASDGIGKCFVKELARLEFNVVLIARNEIKLSNLVESELKPEFPSREFKTVVVDFQKGDDLSLYKDIEKQTLGLDIAILINNVGRTAMGSLADSKEEELRQMMIINCFPAVFLTKLLLKRLQLRDKPAALINVSSLVGLHPTPYLTTYAGTKSFLNIFSDSLGYEEDNKLDTLSLCPYYVSTKMTHFQKLQFDTISPEECASAALKNLSLRRSRCLGHWKHELIGFALENMPKLFTKLRAKQLRESAQRVARVEEAMRRRSERKSERKK